MVSKKFCNGEIILQHKEEGIQSIGIDELHRSYDIIPQYSSICTEVKITLPS